MRARFAAVLGAVVLIAAACQAATPSASAPSAAPPSAAPSVAPSACAVGRRTDDVLRVARISDFLPSIHPVDLGTGNQELMADIVFSTLVDVDKRRGHDPARPRRPSGRRRPTRPSTRSS